MSKLEKPIAPIQPQAKDFPIKGKVGLDSPFVAAYRKWEKEQKKYLEQREIYEQTKMIEDIKRSSVKLCLGKYKIKFQK
jgi:hypothetical protein